MPREPGRRRRWLVGAALRLASTALVALPALMVLAALAAPAGAFTGAGRGRLCLRASAGGDTLDLILDAVTRRGDQVELLGVRLASTGTLPLSGTGRLRNDGLLDFGVATAGHVTIAREVISGRIDPGTGSGSGRVVQYAVPSQAAATFESVTCPTVLPDPA